MLRGARAWTPINSPISVTLSRFSGAATPPRGGTRPRRTAASSASSRPWPLPASRPAQRSTTKAFADAVRDQLLAVDGVLVWVDPIHQGKTRAALDPLLRAIALQGPWVSAHPDVILKMGVKDVLYRTRHLGWGADTHRYDSAESFRAEFPSRLQTAGTRVRKQNGGNGGKGFGKVEALHHAGGMVRVLHAQRGSQPEEMPLDTFMVRCEPYFGWGGCIIDQRSWLAFNMNLIGVSLPASILATCQWLSLFSRATPHKTLPAAYGDRARSSGFGDLRDLRCRLVPTAAAGGGAHHRAHAGAAAQCRQHLSRRSQSAICRPRQPPRDCRRSPAEHDQPAADTGFARFGSAI